MLRLYLLYALSGFLSLGYQVAWFRIFVDSFGSTNITFAFVIANFIGGLGAGSLASRRLVQRLAELVRVRDPLRLYGLLELGVGATVLATLLVPLLPADLWTGAAYVPAGDIHRPPLLWHLAQLAISTLVVFVPCFLMGITFPLLCEARRDQARFPAGLYAWNTFGACVGVLASEIVLLAMLGHTRMLVVLAAANLALGAFFWFAPSAWRGLRTARAGPAALARSTTAAATRPATQPLYAASVLFLGATLSGFLTGAFEADVLRRLQFVDCRTAAALSCISFWCILAIALASATVRALPRLALRHVQIAAVAAFLVYVAVWHFAYRLRDWVDAADRLRVQAALPPMPQGLSVSYQFFNLGYGVWPVLWFTGLFVLPPFYLLSLFLPHLCNAAHAERRHLGLVYGVNTLAFCAGLLAFTTVAPRVNVFYAMRLFLGLFALAVLVLVALRPRDRHVGRKAGLAALLLLALAWMTPRGFAPGYFAPGDPAAALPVRAMKSNGAHTTYVVADPAGDVLYFDSHPMSGCNAPAQQYMRLMAHFPLLAHERPAAALLIGFGVGNTASAILLHETIERLDVVDLNHQVFATASEFAPVNRNAHADPRVRLVHDDGRRFLRLTPHAYDLITSEPPPPMLPGVSRLYSVEYYRDARACLTPGGLITQWLPIDQMPLPAMRAALAAFVQVFPDSLLFVGQSTNYILMGSNRPLQLATVESRWLESPQVREDLAPFGVRGVVPLLARITKIGPGMVREFAKDVAIRDPHNDLSRMFHDPAAPPVLTYDPTAVLAHLTPPGARPLACRDELASTVLHLGRLVSMVPDFPESALMSVRHTGGTQVALAHIDWHTVARRIEASERALAAGDTRVALEHLQQVLEMAPEYPAIALQTAALLSRTQQWEAALVVWRRLQAMDPSDPVAACGAAVAHFRLGRRDEALAMLEVQAQRHPQAADVQRLHGDVLAASERWSAALAAYERALRADPDDQASAAGRARCLERVQR
ncbi:MAG TPA: tetratricopeptide repeat protein [Planctomycetota bacterium]|nr:tetratricopeptide repeat protein [Planctomycetota bacterium]